MDYFLKKYTVIKFKQSTWSESYISFNTKYRAEANGFQKNQYKFLNNSEFGKTIQNNRKQRNIQLVTNEKTSNRLASSVTLRKANI